jgi:hypothetical protein
MGTPMLVRLWKRREMVQALYETLGEKLDDDDDRYNFLCNFNFKKFF